MTIDNLNKNFKYIDIYNFVKQNFLNANIKDYETDARELCIHFLGEDFLFKKNNILNDFDIFNNILNAIKKRKSGDTIETITNIKFFFEGEFYVNKNVLTPRFDTERLVEFVVGYFGRDEKIFFADLCCGTGCIGVSILNKFQNFYCDFYDISNHAIECTNLNLKKYNKQNNGKTILSDMFDKFENKKYDFIISNPPYITNDDYKFLDNDVLLNDPKIALTAEEEGLIFYKNIKDNAYKYIKNNGILIIEFGINQNKCVEDIFKSEKYVKINDIVDYGNTVRGMVFKINNG